MKAVIGLLIAATLFAGGAVAQTNTAAAPGAAQATASPSGKPPTVGAKTVEGLTVTGKAFPKTECGSRDAECIRTVVAELKRLYPEQLKRFCFQREMRAARDTLSFGDTDPGGTRPAQTGMTFTPAAPLAIACSNDPK